MNFIRFSRKEGKIHVSYGCEGFLGNYEAEVRDSIFQCNAGINTASVLADGAISGCPSIRANFHQGNIYKDDFIDIWNNEFKPYRNRQWAKKGNARIVRCSVIAKATGCTYTMMRGICSYATIKG